MLLQKYRDRNGRCIAIPFKVSGSEVDSTLLRLLGVEKNNYDVSSGMQQTLIYRHLILGNSLSASRLLQVIY